MCVSLQLNVEGEEYREYKMASRIWPDKLLLDMITTEGENRLKVEGGGWQIHILKVEFDLSIGTSSRKWLQAIRHVLLMVTSKVLEYT